MARSHLLSMELQTARWFKSFSKTRTCIKEVRTAHRCSRNPGPSHCLWSGSFRLGQLPPKFSLPALYWLLRGTSLTSPSLFTVHLHLSHTNTHSTNPSKDRDTGDVLNTLSLVVGEDMSIINLEVIQKSGRCIFHTHTHALTHTYRKWPLVFRTNLFSIRHH